jgi:HEAT repeat protein
MRSASAALAVLLAACSSPSKPAPASSGPSGLVAPEELPPRKREVLEAWRAGGVRWEAERDRAVADPELARFLVDNLVVQMVRSYDRSRIGSAFRPSSPFTAAQDELVRLSEHSTPLLAEMLLLRDDVVAFLAADTLKRIGAPAVDPVAAKLGEGPPEVRRRIAELVGELPEGREEPRILEKLGRAAEHDEAWIVRAQSARSLGSRAARRAEKGYAAAVLSRALADPDAEVRKTSLRALADLGDASAVPALIRALERAAAAGDLPALRSAQSALRELTKLPRDLDPEEWWKLWEERKAPR